MSNAQFVDIPGVGQNLPGIASKSVSPKETTTYTLTATNAAGSVTKKVKVVVTGGSGGAGDPLEQALFTEVNARRASQGLAALTRDSFLDQLARDHSAYMAAAGTVSHDGEASRWAQVQTVGATLFGENVLMAPQSYSAAQMVDLWWGSPGHKANMLNQAFAESGMGIVKSGGYVYATQIFTD